MIVLEGAGPDGEAHQARLIALFGLGLIGRSIVAELRRSHAFRAEYLPFAWEDGTARRGQIEAMVAAFVDRIRTPRCAPSPTVRFVWTAGAGGFGSTTEQLAPELASFNAVLRIAVRIWEATGSSVAVHLMSSAGGLYEGQVGVGPGSATAPIRPYGVLKLQQEQAMERLPAEMPRYTYRPSSVYGFVDDHTRLGLITTMLRNGLLRKVTRVFGDMSTLRDYLPANDIARFVARQILAVHPRPGPFILASGKPTTIQQIQQLTESVLDQKLYVSYRPDLANAAHNTYRPAYASGNWQPTDLLTGMQLTRLHLINHMSRQRPRRPA